MPQFRTKGKGRNRKVYPVTSKVSKRKMTTASVVASRKPKPKVITVIAKRWRDSNGNTYHSTKVYADGKLVGEDPYGYRYGYGEQYKQTAHEILQNAGYYPKTGKRLASGMDADYYDFMNDTREHRDRFIFDVSDVSRKKDL